MIFVRPYYHRLLALIALVMPTAILADDGSTGLAEREVEEEGTARVVFQHFI